jgi:hypothetical protein
MCAVSCESLRRWQRFQPAVPGHVYIQNDDVRLGFVIRLRAAEPLFTVRTSYPASTRILRPISGRSRYHRPAVFSAPKRNSFPEKER